MSYEQEFQGLRPSVENDPERFEIKSADTYFVPLDSINVATQTRKVPDSESLEEAMKTKTEKNGQMVTNIKLIQPPTVGYFESPEELKDYLAKLNSTFGSDHKVEDFQPLAGTQSSYIFMVAGHRRLAAIRNLVDNEINSESVRSDLECHVLSGDELSFNNAVRVQYKENFHKPLETWEDANAVNAIFIQGLNDGSYSSFAECAEDLGIHPDRVSRAWRYKTLPDEIQEQCEEGTLAYGRAMLVGDVGVAHCWKWCEDQLEANPSLKEKLTAKYKAGKLYITDFSELLDEAEKEELTARLLIHSGKITGLRTNSQAVGYASEQVQALMNQDQLVLNFFTEEKILAQQDQVSRTETRNLAVAALRQLVAVLHIDKNRIEGGLPPVLARSSRITNALSNLALRAGEVRDYRNMPHSDILAAIHGAEDSIEAIFAALDIEEDVEWAVHVNGSNGKNDYHSGNGHGPFKPQLEVAESRTN